ncbi:MAG: hypothetical protein KA350_08085, partial [Arenimonas sp.]|nr:hypothetical protein [Arenimonas sp.]
MISGLITPTQRQWLNSLFLVIAMAMFSHSSIAAERWQALTQPVFQTIEHSARPLVGPIRATAQDRDGYIWLVSDTTLWRWDAYQLVQVTFNLTSIKNGIIPDINIIKSDPNGELWIGTSNGLFRINQSLLKLEPVVVNALNNQTIDLIEFDYRNGKKRMFLGNEYHVLEWQVGTQTVNRLSLGTNPENRVHAMAIDSTQQLYVGTTNGLLIKSLDEPSNSPLRLSSTMSVERRISALFIDSAQQLWIGTAKNGVYLINQKQQLQVIALPKQTSSSPWIYDITEIRPGVIWFGTYGKGILQFESADQTFSAIRQQRGLIRNLLDNDIWTFFKDRRGLIWIGTRRGVNIYDPSQSAFHYVPGDMNGPNGVRDSQIFSVIATKDDHLWLGTGSNGIEIIHPEKGYVQQLQPGQRFGSIPIPDDAIETLFLADQQTVLAGSNWSTLHISRQPLSVKALSLEGRDSDAFSGAFANHHGNLWVGGIDGLWRLSGVDGNEAINVTKGKPVDYRVSKLLSTKDALWVGTWKGLYSVTEKNSAVPAWQITPVKDTFLNQQYITDLAQDAKQRIWVGTYSAGLLHNTAEGIAGNLPWQIISAKQGLPGNSIASIKADLIGNLWVATSQGIAVINVNTLKIDAIPSEQGSAAAPYEDGALTAAGEIAFVGNNGLTIIDPKLWQAINFKAPIALSNIDSNSDKKLSLQKTKMADGQWK